MLYTEKHIKKSDFSYGEKSVTRREIKGVSLWLIVLLCALALLFCAKFFIDFMRSFSIYNDSIYIQPSGTQC